MSNPFFAKLSAKALTNPDDVCFDLHGMSGLEKSLTFSHMRKGLLTRHKASRNMACEKVMWS